MNILILGGNSDIGYAVAKAYAKQDKASITLASRNIEILQKKASDLSIRSNVKIDAVKFDATDYESHQNFYASLSVKPDIVIVAAGIYHKLDDHNINSTTIRETIDTNFGGLVNILEIIAKDFQTKKSGKIIGISSVAGVRGRASNRIYGASKAGFTAYLSGLRNRLAKHHVHVLTVLPGFVQTKLVNNPPALITSTPDKMARVIYKAEKKNRHIIYSTWYWRLIMHVIKLIPERWFKYSGL